MPRVAAKANYSQNTENQILAQNKFCCVFFQFAFIRKNFGLWREATEKFWEEEA